VKYSAEIGGNFVVQMFDEEEFPIKTFLLIIFITLTVVSPVSNYFLHYDQSQLLFLPLLPLNYILYFLYYNPHPVTQYSISIIDLTVIHLALLFAALISVFLVWILITKSIVQEKLGIRIHKNFEAPRLLPFIIFSTLIPTISVAILLFETGLIGLGPAIHFTVQASILTIVTGWIFSTYTRPLEVVTGISMKNVRIVLMIATIISLSAIWVLSNIYSVLEIASDVFKIVYPSTWFVLSQTIPLVRFPEVGKFTLTWVLLIFYYIFIAYNSYHYLVEKKRRDLPPEILTDWDNILKEVSENEREYLEEAMKCANHKCYRASIVLAWCATIDRIERVIVRRGLDKFNEKFQRRFKRSGPRNLTELRLNVGDSEKLWVLMDMGLLTQEEENDLYACFKTRNNCAHPGERKISLKKLNSFYDDIRTIIFENDKFKIRF